MVEETKSKLGREAWIGAALAAISREGVRAVRVEALARELGVTKGSFYWHFRDRAALLDAVLETWERRGTTRVIERVEAGTPTGAQRLERLVEIAFATDEVDRIEAGIRAWGASDGRASVVLRRTDARRLDYVTEILVGAGLDRRTAKKRAHILFLALIGDFTFRAHGGGGSSRQVRKELVELLLVGTPL